MLSARFGGNPGKAAMVELRRIAMAAAAYAATWIPALADEQKQAPAPQAYTPRVNSLMILTQLGHFKLWCAGAVQAPCEL